MKSSGLGFVLILLLIVTIPLGGLVVGGWVLVIRLTGTINNLSGEDKLIAHSFWAKRITRTDLDRFDSVLTSGTGGDVYIDDTGRIAGPMNGNPHLPEGFSRRYVCLSGTRRTRDQALNDLQKALDVFVKDEATPDTRASKDGRP